MVLTVRSVADGHVWRWLGGKTAILVCTLTYEPERTALLLKDSVQGPHCYDEIKEENTLIENQAPIFFLRNVCVVNSPIFGVRLFCYFRKCKQITKKPRCSLPCKFKNIDLWKTTVVLLLSRGVRGRHESRLSLGCNKGLSLMLIGGHP